LAAAALGAGRLSSYPLGTEIMMRLFVLGATGRTGAHIVDLALARGHRVTAFVRSPRKILRTHARLTVVNGDVFAPTQMGKALRGHDAVLSALGPGFGQVLRRETLMKDATESTLDAMAQAQTARLLVMSSALLFPGGGVAVGVFRAAIGHHVRDLRAMEDLVRTTPSAWTIARPPRLVATSEEEFLAADGGMPEPLSARSAMSWRAVANFLVDAVEQRAHVRQIVGLIGRRRVAAAASSTVAP
jgi:putative NADH-flavin reductase